MAAFVGALVVPVRVHAQDVSGSALVVSANHTLLGNALVGGAVGFRFPYRDTRLAVHFELAHARGSANRFGVACAGLIQPGTCPNEPLRDHAMLSSASGGAHVRVLTGEYAQLALTADLTLAPLSTDTRGATTGRSLPSSKMLWGGAVGVHAAWTPIRQAPISMVFAAGLGGLLPIVKSIVVDGYTPFENGFTLKRARLGVSWRP